MPPAPPDDALAALREEIRRAGASARSLRLWLCGTLPLLLAVLVGPVLAEAVVPGERERMEPGFAAFFDDVTDEDWRLLGWIWASSLVGVAALSTGLAAGLLVRTIRACQLRTQLGRLSEAEQAALLRSLREERGDTGKIVTLLLRQGSRRWRPTEPVPTAAPAERGNELTTIR